jgi:hypothetical protein
VRAVVFQLMVIVPMLLAQTRGILIPGKGWELLGADYQLTADSAVDPEGRVYCGSMRYSPWSASKYGPPIVTCSSKVFGGMFTVSARMSKARRR